MIIPQRQTELDDFYVKYLADEPKAEGAGFPPGSARSAAGGYLPTVEEVIEKLKSEKGGKAGALLEGDTSGYKSPSEAEQALFNKVYFYTQDYGQVVEVYRRSGLYRAKGRRKDYLRRTYLKAANTITAFYDWTPPMSFNTSGKANSPNSPNRSGTISAVELLSMKYPPTQWVIPDILPEGVTLLVGKPKKGKSWMALDMCEAIASGGLVFGIKEVESGESLYLALEDNRRRLQKRLKKVLDGRPAPERMHVHVEWPKLADGGTQLLDEWLTEHPETRLVVIDTLTKVRNPARGQNIYTEDYAALETLLPIAAAHSVAIVVVYHLRKAAATDPLDEISSSTGLTAGVDGFMILRRTPGSKGPTLYVDGRDIEEPTEYALHWNLNTATWTIEGTAEEVHVSKERADILLVLNRSEEPMTPKEVWEELPGTKRNNVRYLMSMMLRDGQLIKEAGSRYSPADPTNPRREPGFQKEEPW